MKARPGVGDGFYSGCLVAVLMVVPVWVLLALWVYWLGHR